MFAARNMLFAGRISQSVADIYREAVMADSPVAYWRQHGATLIDSSGNGLTGTYYNSPTTGVEGPMAGGFATRYNGSNQYGGIAHNAFLDVTNLTLECWVKWITSPDRKSVV